jgi:hypothetical protein
MIVVYAEGRWCRLLELDPQRRGRKLRRHAKVERQTYWPRSGDRERQIELRIGQQSCALQWAALPFRQLSRDRRSLRRAALHFGQSSDALQWADLPLRRNSFNSDRRDRTVCWRRCFELDLQSGRQFPFRQRELGAALGRPSFRGKRDQLLFGRRSFDRNRRTAPLAPSVRLAIDDASQQFGTRLAIDDASQCIGPRHFEPEAARRLARRPSMDLGKTPSPR